MDLEGPLRGHVGSHMRVGTRVRGRVLTGRHKRKLPVSCCSSSTQFCRGERELTVLAVEGSIAFGPDGTGMVDSLHGRPKKDIVFALAHKVTYVVAMGTCACFGGVVAAEPNPHRRYWTAVPESGERCVAGTGVCVPRWSARGQRRRLPGPSADDGGARRVQYKKSADAEPREVLALRAEIEALKSARIAECFEARQ